MTTDDSTLDHALNADIELDAQLNATDDPVIVQMKNEHRIDRIRARLRASATIQMKTSPISRVLRRDWNIVSAKLFLNSLDGDYQQQIRRDLDELHWQVDDLLDQLRATPFGPLDSSWMTPRLLNVQVIHPLTASWLRAFRTFDACFEVLINAERAQKITRKQRFAFTAPVQLAYFSFKATAMKLPLKTTDELLDDAGLAET
ncbi:MAG: hypothetical protein KGZ70_13765 [Hydrogenophaga sp.]|nr:hypothetical protein [Hydrogenophaga sp.]